MAMTMGKLDQDFEKELRWLDMELLTVNGIEIADLQVSTLYTKQPSIDSRGRISCLPPGGAAIKMETIVTKGERSGGK